jgi:predicted TIM-barrel fold metal-dependent hydrolase
MATVMKESKSAHIHRQLSHPVVDGDGHWLEPMPVFLEYLSEIGSPKMVDDYIKQRDERSGKWYAASPEERMRQRLMRPVWWGEVGNTLDRTTASVPQLMHERLGEFGIDFAIVYPSLGLVGPSIQQDELRRAFARAHNTMVADMFRPYADRMTPVAVVPTHTPQEATEEAEYAVKTLGLKAIMANGNVRRTVEADEEWQSDPARRRYYIDCLAMDSPYDYNPFWAKCVELKVAVTTHAGSMGWVDRASPTSYVVNHLGHFAQSNQAFARNLFMGGVTQRFPTLNFAFLEGGVGWACNLYADLFGHWEKRSKRAMHQRLDPMNLDRDEMRRLLGKYKRDERINRYVEPFLKDMFNVFEPGKSNEELSARDRDADDFYAVRIESKDDIPRLFARNFYFGCESDDPITAWAFHPRTRLKPIFSSDISHFDVTDFTEVLEEAYELVEDGLITEQDFREFTFGNAVSLHGGMNPNFFKGTAVEAAARKELS